MINAGYPCWTAIPWLEADIVAKGTGGSEVSFLLRDIINSNFVAGRFYRRKPFCRGLWREKVEQQRCDAEF
jgi:hypothetical protein